MKQPSKLSTCCVAICFLFLKQPVHGSLQKAPASNAKTARTKGKRLEDSKPKSGTESLVFTSDCTLLSEPYDVQSKDDLADFFKRQETMKLFLSAGGKRSCTGVPITPDIRSLWEKASHKHYGSQFMPSDNDVAVATDTDAQFPGFKMVTTVLNGCKRLEDSHGMPVYEFCMIGDRTRIVGSPPVVWLVRKLTGQSKEDESDTFQLSETKAKSTISIADQGKATCAFQLDLQFQTTVKFPKMLLRLLPASKSKVEERGTQSVTKALLKDAGGAVQVVRENWTTRLDYKERTVV